MYAKRARQELHRLERKREELEQLRETFKNDSGRHTLVLLDATSGDHLQAAVAIGEVDEADHIVVHTPGMTSLVNDSLVREGGSWGKDVDAMQHVLDEANGQLAAQDRDQEQVAAVVWLGYDAPQWGEEVFTDHSVALSDQAEAGGERLAGFLDSLQSTHNGDPHLVASGHSYGSSVTGYALQETAAPDEFNALGSPGVSANHVGPLHIIPGKFNVASAPGDGVAAIARFGGQPPVNEGHRIGTGGWTSPEGIDYSPSYGHSQYFDAGHTSTYDQGSILIGNGVASGG